MNKKFNCNLTWGNVIISKYKSFEYQFGGYNFATNPFEFSIRWTTKCDHAGISFTFSIYKLFWINFKIYDHRHWDYNNNSYKHSC